eukprot:TRINITY_DN39570_c0_g1_i1.p1 TRINITY_DN39570_c0_g1~~TRINITY_DN39570_c0_g1_i1.p1  ORF type:complete len:265 (+),score=30.50 TRINITY_DN39570_c0_g1_i1:38-796(+)
MALALRDCNGAAMCARSITAWCGWYANRRCPSLPRQQLYRTLVTTRVCSGDSTQSRSWPSTRVRESGMPPVDYWESLIDAERTLDRLGMVKDLHKRAVELGCGYGTFSLPIARRVGELVSLDLDSAMLQHTLARAEAAGLSNVIRGAIRDVVADGYGIEPGSCDAVFLLNILHGEDPVAMLRDAATVLSPGEGRIYVTHWRHDPSTPRGPPMEIRPRPEQLEEWAFATRLLGVELGPVDCPPWHYGLVFKRL